MIHHTENCSMFDGKEVIKNCNSHGKLESDDSYQIHYNKQLILKNGNNYGKILRMENDTYTIKRISDNKYINGTIQVITFTN